MVSNTRLYGATIGFASGLYSLWSASTAPQMVASAWFMALLGVVVLVHGAVLLTPYADRLGDASGPLMVGYAVAMLANQTLLATGMVDDGSPVEMGGGMGGMGGQVPDGMGWDAGMVALAAVMLASGIIMTRGGDGETDAGGM